MQSKFTAVLSAVTIMFLLVVGCESPNEPLTKKNETVSSGSTMLAKSSYYHNGGNRYKECSHKNIYEHKRDCELHQHDKNCEHSKNDYSSKQCSHKTQYQHDRDCSIGNHDTECNHDDDDECNCDADGIVILWAGQHTAVGTVTVTRDNNNLKVTYVVNSPWKIRETHLDISAQQYTQRGAPGQYDYSSYSVNGVSTYTYTIPITWTTGTKLYFLAHAVVGKYSTSYCTGTETAFGGTVVDPRYGSWFATFCFAVPPGTITPQTYSINGSAFVDANSNGVQDVGEVGLANVSVSLNTGATATTNSSGQYSFSGLLAGSYTITGNVVSGYNQTTTASVGVVITNANGSANFGYAVAIPQLYTISGHVFFDTDGNGLQDPGETTPIANVLITISTGETTITDADGFYSFSGLSPETYSIYPGLVTGLNVTSAPTVKVIISNANGSANFGFNDGQVPLRVISQSKKP